MRTNLARIAYIIRLVCLYLALTANVHKIFCLIVVILQLNAGGVRLVNVDNILCSDFCETIHLSLRRLLTSPLRCAIVF